MVGLPRRLSGASSSMGSRNEQEPNDIANSRRDAMTIEGIAVGVIRNLHARA